MVQKLRAILSDWDVKDTRSLVIGICLAIIPLYGPSIANWTTEVVVRTSLVVSSRFIDSLYVEAGSGPIARTTAITAVVLSLIPANILIGVLILLKFYVTPLFKVGEQDHQHVRSKAPAVASLVILTICALLVLSVLMTEIMLPLAANAKFERSLAAIGPVTSQKVMSELRSQWAFMRSRADYDKIMLSIKNIMSENHMPSLP